MHRTVFTQSFISTGTLLTQRNLYTQTAQRRFYTPFFARRNFTQNISLHSNNFSAQKPLRTQVFTHSSFYKQTVLHTETIPDRSLTFYAQQVLHTDAFTHRCLYTEKIHKNLCTQHAFTHSLLLHREVLLPFLTTYLSCFPSQVNLCDHKLLDILGF